MNNQPSASERDSSRRLQEDHAKVARTNTSNHGCIQQGLQNDHGAGGCGAAGGTSALENVCGANSQAEESPAELPPEYYQAIGRAFFQALGDTKSAASAPIELDDQLRQKAEQLGQLSAKMIEKLADNRAVDKSMATPRTGRAFKRNRAH